MENSLTISRRVPSPRGGYLGVRAHVAGKGWWVGCEPQDYEAREAELERQAIEKAHLDG